MNYDITLSRTVSTETTLTQEMLRDFMRDLETTTYVNFNRNYTIYTGSSGSFGFQLFNDLMVETTPDISDPGMYSYRVVPKSETVYIEGDKIYLNGKVYAESKDPGRLKDLKKRLERIGNG